jgi:hypothetical protein
LNFCCVLISIDSINLLSQPIFQCRNDCFDIGEVLLFCCFVFFFLFCFVSWFGIMISGCFQLPWSDRWRQTSTKSNLIPSAA